MTMQDATGIHGKLFAALERAPLEQSAWHEVCDRLSDLVDGSGALFVSVEQPSDGYFLPASSRLCRHLDEYYRHGWYSNDPRIMRGAAKFWSRGWTYENDFVSEAEMRRHPYYEEFLARAGLRWHLSVCLNDSRQSWCVAIQGAATRTPFADRDAQVLLPLRPYLSQALQQTRAAGAVRKHKIGDGVTTLGYAFVIVGDRGRIVEISAAADRYFGTLFRYDHHCLTLKDSDADKRLRFLVTEAVAPRDTGQARPLVVTYDADCRASIDVIRMPRDFLSEVVNARAVVLIRDILTKDSGTAEFLKSAFGLTPAEADIANLLLRGKSAGTIAQARRSGEQTVRTQIKSIYRKTGVSSHAQLVSLLNDLGC